MKFKLIKIADGVVRETIHATKLFCYGHCTTLHNFADAPVIIDTTSSPAVDVGVEVETCSCIPKAATHIIAVIPTSTICSCIRIA